MSVFVVCLTTPVSCGSPAAWVCALSWHGRCSCRRAQITSSCCAGSTAPLGWVLHSSLLTTWLMDGTCCALQYFALCCYTHEAALRRASMLWSAQAPLYACVCGVDVSLVWSLLLLRTACDMGAAGCFSLSGDARRPCCGCLVCLCFIFDACGSAVNFCVTLPAQSCSVGAQSIRCWGAACWLCGIRMGNTAYNITCGAAAFMSQDSFIT
jgi:hypothetical protein